ncbi:mitochondrial DNA-directed RNA polymerase [Sordaria brevicollis]|uniref:DNA-directed RNA polymerase n=1 Tax=Sordaria brevicollis TaxID=83679 RepID=A0AAE0PI40_SORBR|nr:mitochondrial DNA-directed RNA polymerase [Sordaria brevicollis]
MLPRTASATRTPHINRLVSAGSGRLLPRCSPSLGARASLAATHRLLSTITTQQPSPLKRQPAPRATVGFERHLATVLDEPAQTATTPLYELRSFSPQAPLKVRDNTAHYAKTRINFHGIPGDVNEMFLVFEACLQVGRLERAAQVLKRLAVMDVLPSSEYLDLYNQYLDAKVCQLLEEPGAIKADDIHKSFETMISGGRDVHVGGETVALLLKASLTSTNPAKMQLYVDRYLSLLPAQTALETVFNTEILTYEELTKVAELCPKYNMPDNVDPETFAMQQLQQQQETTSGQSEELPQHLLNSIETSAIPEVLGTPQKGYGLQFVKKTISMFQGIPDGFDISTLPLSQQREIQSKLERDCVDASLARWREENESLQKMGLNTTLDTPSLNSRLYQWQKALESRLRTMLEEVEKSEQAPKKTKDDLDRCIYGPFIRQSNPERLAAVTIISTLSSLAMGGAHKGSTLSGLITHIAKFAEEDIKVQKVEALANKYKLRKAKSKQHLPRSVLRFKNSHAAADLAADSDVDVVMEDEAWTTLIRTKVGAALLSALLDTAKIQLVREDPATKTLITQNQPAFSHVMQLRKGKKVGTIVPNKAVVDLLAREPVPDFLARHLPMVTTPDPWVSFEKGAYLETKTPVLRLKNGEREQKLYTEAAIARGDMDQVLKGLDVLGKTGWKVNSSVFKVMLEVWNSGQPIANIPPLNPVFDLPPEPEATDDPSVKRAWLKEVKAVENERSGLHSQRCFMNFQLEIARAYRDQTFYFPHNVDFRGRAYPIPPYLNHMGADHVRGLMLFAKGKPLGESGLRWLKVHLANVYGFDKASLQERQDFADENVENIRDSVENPLNGNQWWLKAEDPWQCLATCFELKAALDLEDPTQYVSHLPIHQDGTCNGLQHYAALGGDTWGAQQVNLIPGDRPADVYSAVAKLVIKGIEEDLAKGNEFAKAINGKITRKVVKQTVMTNVYGVTYVGAKKQVQKQIDAAYPNIEAESGIESPLIASYVTQHIFKAMSTMFKGAHDIQSWLGEIGGRVCRALTPEQLEEFERNERFPNLNGTTDADVTLTGKTKKSVTLKSDEILNNFQSTIIWTTPLRMPVVQPYRKHGTKTVSTCMQDLVMTIPERSDPVNRRKQLQAFPPNFIHSLDASHMLLSALQCDELGLTFAAVHDSFWTHAADVDSMNGVIRDSFIRIHSEDVIGRLAAEFQARYKNSIYLAKIEASSKPGQEISRWRAMHKLGPKKELLLEKERQELLRSSNPEDVERGKKMVTPASIYELYSSDQDLTVPEDLKEVTIGNISSGSEEKKAASAQEMDEEMMGEEDGGEEAVEHEDEVDNETETLEELRNTNHFALAQRRQKKALGAGTPKFKPYFTIWLPLTFPAIPAKGDFDVRELKDSTYFFS